MFLWDQANTEHIARHGVLPEEAEQVIENDPLDLERQIQNDEERFLHLGETAAGRILFVVVTVRGYLLRVVTAYPANKKSKNFYVTRKGASNAEKARDS